MPANAMVLPGTEIQFEASAVDQFGNPLTDQPSITWLAGSCDFGTLGSDGTFSAGTQLGTCTIEAEATIGDATFTGSVEVIVTNVVQVQGDIIGMGAAFGGYETNAKEMALDAVTRRDAARGPSALSLTNTDHAVGFLPYPRALVTWVSTQCPQGTIAHCGHSSLRTCRVHHIGRWWVHSNECQRPRQPSEADAGFLPRLAERLATTELRLISRRTALAKNSERFRPAAVAKESAASTSSVGSMRLYRSFLFSMTSGTINRTPPSLRALRTSGSRRSSSNPRGAGRLCSVSA